MKLSDKLINKILIGTHHKTGTVWLKSIFEKVCHLHDLKFYYGVQKDLPKQYDVFFQDHSKFDFETLNVLYRGLHIIRDPRDVIISGCFYHQRSKETWLHIPLKKLNGLTYHQKINSFKNIDDKILFEMEHSGSNTIHGMLDWDYNRKTFFEVKYEELIKDVDLILFQKIFAFLGFPENMIPGLLIVAYNNSLFSNQIINPHHIRSGEANEWKKYFKKHHQERFIQLFGDALIRLGYTTDNNWLPVSCA